MIYIKNIKNIIKRHIKLAIMPRIEEIFPLRIDGITRSGKFLTHRDKFYILRVANIKCTNLLDKMKRQFKLILSEYGYISIILVICFIITLSLILREDLFLIFLFRISHIKDITGWIGDIATASVSLLALFPIHHKTNIDVESFVNLHNVAVQLLNKNNSSTFVKLNHIYICNKDRSLIWSMFDLRKYFESYMRWKLISSHDAYTLWIIKDGHDFYFKKLYLEYMQLYKSFLKSSTMHYIVFEFDVNDHNFDIASKVIDINKLWNKFEG